MAKMRVYEYAKAINVSSKEILTALKNMDIVVNNHMAMLEEKTIKQLDAKFKKGGAGVTSQKPAETNKNKPQGINQQPAGNQPNKIRDGKKNDVQNNQFNKNKKNNNNNKNKNKRNHNNKNQYQQKPLKPKKSFLRKLRFPAL